MPLNPLNHHYAMENPASVYDEEAMTALELAGRTASKVNECVDAFNELEVDTSQHLEKQDQAIQTMNNETMPATVTAEVQRKIDSGEFDNAINTYAGELEARVDNLLGSMPEGGTIMDAEVIDIRTGADGIIYPTAGEAVRGQFKKVNYSPILRANGECNNMINYAEIIKGHYVNIDGSILESADFNCTPFIKVEPGKTYTFYQCGLSSWYDTSGVFVSYFTPGNGTFTVADGIGYIRISLPVAFSEWAMYRGEFHLVNDYGVPTNTKKKYEFGYIPFTVKVNQKPLCGSGYAGQEDFQTELVSVNCHLSLSQYTYTPHGKPAPLVMLIHGAGQGAEQWKTNEYYNNLVRGLLAQGYCVFDCNGFKNDALGYSYWGDMRGVEAYRKAYDYVVNNYNVEKDVNIYAFSMGGLTAMNLLANNFPNVKCVALGSPVLSMEACWNDTSVRPVLRTLYNIPSTVTTYDDSYFVGVNPYKHIISNGDDKYFNVALPPLKIWYGGLETGGTTDTGTGENVGGAVNKQHAIDLVGAVQNSGGYAFYRECPNCSHDICYGSTQYVINEICIFLNRFNDGFNI